jgi:hypothetical protein
MSFDLENELAKEFKAAQDKYIYFLLAAAASAIGYAITQLEVEPLTCYHIPLGLSILLWSTSFFSGIQFIENLTGTLFKNHNFLAFKREIKFLPTEESAELLKKFQETYNATIENHQRKMSCYGNLQSKCLLLGAFFYISWHVLKMLSISA